MGASHCWTDWISLTLLNWLDFTVSEDKQSKLLRDNVRHIVPISARQKLLARNWQQYFGVWIPNLFPSYWSLSTCFHNLPSLFPGSAECIWVSPLRFNCNFPSSTRHVWADHSLILNMCLLHQRDRFWQIKKKPSVIRDCQWSLLIAMVPRCRWSCFQISDHRTCTSGTTEIARPESNSCSSRTEVSSVMLRHFAFFHTLGENVTNWIYLNSHLVDFSWGKRCWMTHQAAFSRSLRRWAWILLERRPDCVHGSSQILGTCAILWFDWSMVFTCVQTFANNIVCCLYLFIMSMSTLLKISMWATSELVPVCPHPSFVPDSRTRTWARWAWWSQTFAVWWWCTALVVSTSTQSRGEMFAWKEM